MLNGWKRIAAWIVLTAVLVGTSGGARATTTPPAYCSELSWIVKNWRKVAQKQPIDVRSRVLAGRVGRVAVLAAADGRTDVAAALTLSSRWVASGASFKTASLARKQHLQERTTEAGWKANSTIRADCGFAPYRTRPSNQ